jgi:hypothetical protein
MPAWIKERREDGVLAILGSEPPVDAEPQFIPIEKIENVIESEHEVNGLRFAIIVMRDEK